MANKTRAIAEYGDFQTPDDLARAVVGLVRRLGARPGAIIEPSCGKGAFLAAAARSFPGAALTGVEINGEYLGQAEARLAGHPHLNLVKASFFDVDWPSLVAAVEAPVLILGNPPWVTNSGLGMLGSGNLPLKSNFQKMKGLEALTGKSNFDISEWMLLRNLEWIGARGGTLAILCKTAVARKVVRHAWRQAIPVSDARLYRIDSARHFGVSVDACLLYISSDLVSRTCECKVYKALGDSEPEGRFGIADGALVADMASYAALDFLRAADGPRWRSGLKHDCAAIMELRRREGSWVNGLGELVELEEELLFPLAKSSDVAAGRDRDRRVIVTQRAIGADTGFIRHTAPGTWAYLQRHKATLSARRSAVYRGKPPFSIFGVGDYAFLPWKVAISGLYKSLRFRVFGPRDGKPVMFDDTVYFLPFRSRDEALETLALLESAEARSFLNAMIFWDEKRPITAGILRRLDLEALAALLGKQAGGGATGPACLRVGRDSGPTAAPESRRQAIRPSGPGRR